MLHIEVDECGVLHIEVGVVCSNNPYQVVRDVIMQVPIEEMSEKSIKIDVISTL